ncbi:MAG: endolytic transglycosylase MltG [Clostridia bacterium]|nr:endolytic transglycosylase MltG [Clostridia bacterium]
MIFTDNYNNSGRQPEPNRNISGNRPPVRPQNPGSPNGMRQNLPQNAAGNRAVPPSPARTGMPAQTARPQNVNPAGAARPVQAQVQRNVPPARPAQPVQPIQRKFPEDGLTRTKTTELSKTPAVPAAKPQAKKAEKRERKYAGSDEGGNTVVSVIKAVVYIIFILVVSVFLSIAVIAVANDIYAFVKSDEVVEVTIPEYATLDEVSEILYMNDIIKYPTIFKLYAVAENDNGEFLAGTYSIKPMMNYDDLLAEFKEKPISGTATITIPEGYSTDEIINLMVANGIGTREGYVDVIQNYDFDYWFIDELEASGRMENRLYRLDGYLFPDTYEFYKNSSEVTVINKLLKRFNQIFTREYRDQCAALGYSVDQMITLASMIEKEAASPSEFFWVSSVFHNRLNNPWAFPRMESDATVLYIIAHDKGERPKTVTPEDLQYQTLYNTYMYEGLPPGPIANPSASAMLAALSPVSSDYYYFYYMSSLGRTVYSATKAEHDGYIAQDRQGSQQNTGDVPEGTP